MEDMGYRRHMGNGVLGYRGDLEIQGRQRRLGIHYIYITYISTTYIFYYLSYFADFAYFINLIRMTNVLVCTYVLCVCIQWVREWCIGD